MTFVKEFLLEDGYDWSFDRSNSTLQDVIPTRNRFDRFNGNSVLRMINMYNHLVARVTIRQGQQLELLIAKELPLVLSSEVSVFNWLKERSLDLSTESKYN
jgi:hypothetical protein